MFRARRTRYTATVEAVTPIAPRMTRITLGGPGMSAFRCDEPTQWVKLFVTDPLDGRTVGRAYTVRHQSPSEPRMDVDVVLHGKGPAARWAETVLPGQEVSFGGPKGSFRPVPGADFYLLAGDESAQPAVLTIAEHLPPGTRGAIYLEVTGPEAEIPVSLRADLDVIWVHREAGQFKGEALRDAVLKAAVPQQGVAAWAAGESGAVREIRRHLTENLGLDRQHAYAKGYWKLDEADHRDPLASD
ncbi:siderophore-interacting protein [Streptomyces sp. Marseille-Q5077]|uniref:siderophore-interacting protein n=1 Tax=Streptomyces sp. Marseille-Q5077 TaxID=3418995 RepID=UPI003D043284